MADSSLSRIRKRFALCGVEPAFVRVFSTAKYTAPRAFTVCVINTDYSIIVTHSP